MTRWKSTIRIRIMFSSTCVSIAAVLLVEILCASIVFFVVVFSPLLDTTELGNAQRIADAYAQRAGTHIGIGSSLDPQITFAPNAPAPLLPTDEGTNTPDVTNRVPSLAFPYPDSHLVAFALLLAPDGSVLASSNPHAYPIHVLAVTLLSSRYSLVMHALKGEAETLIVGTATGRLGQACVPVFNQRRHVIGAVYVQLPPDVSTSSFFTNFVGSFLPAALLLLLITIPLGAGLSFMTSRGLLDRMQRLLDATTQVAAGHYQQHIQVMSEDETGVLELRFNLLAKQLMESIEQRQVLLEQNTRLAERARIFRDLHDGVKQQAFALTMQVSTARTLIGTQPEAARTHLQHAEALAYQVQQELTALLHSSHPSVLSEKGLATALQEYVTTWSRQQQIPVQHHIDGCALPPLMEEALLRITQEALSNVARHSHATAVTLDLSCTHERVTLILEDNGCGFDPDDSALVERNGVGLRSMHERLEAFEGTLRIESRKGEGTRIVASCPAPNGKENHEEGHVPVPLLADAEVRE